MSYSIAPSASSPVSTSLDPDSLYISLYNPNKAAASLVPDPEYAQQLVSVSVRACDVSDVRAHHNTAWTLATHTSPPGIDPCNTHLLHCPCKGVYKGSMTRVNTHFRDTKRGRKLYTD